MGCNNSLYGHVKGGVVSTVTRMGHYCQAMSLEAMDLRLLKLPVKIPSKSREIPPDAPMVKNFVSDDKFYLKFLERTTSKVPRESLTYLVAKGTLDESMLWHRRLGHVQNSNDVVVYKESVGTGHSSKETGSSQDYILMSLDAGKKDDKGVSQESGIDDQERPENSTQDVNTAGPTTHADFFGDETELDMSNILTDTNLVPKYSKYKESIRACHLDHSDMVKCRKTHEDLHTCLFACFLSQVEPKKVIQALTDLSWIEQCRVPLEQNGSNINKNDERGSCIRTKTRLVATASTPIDFQSHCSRKQEAKIFQVIPKVSHLHVVKRIFRYLKGQPKLGLWYPKDSPFDLEAYTDSDYAGARLDRKSTTRGCQFLGSRLISWQCKKQTVVANSTTKAKYVAAASCCGQNPVFHLKTKHIEIRHHFIRDSNEKKLIQMIKIHTDQNIVDLLTKAFDVGKFQYLIASIGMLNL
ncbi:hypothetical protein Tco_0865593 [Tanacetum coccineum]